MNSTKLKKIIYSILKEILEGDSVPTSSDFEITDDQFRKIILLMTNENLLNNKRVSFYIDGSLSIEKSIDTLTMKGIEFLEENRKWTKVYKGVKEFRDFLPI